MLAFLYILCYNSIQHLYKQTLSKRRLSVNVLFFVLTGLLAPFLLDAFLRRWLWDVPEITKEGSHGKILFVLLPAAQVRTWVLMARIAPLLRQYGDILTVDGAKKRFNPRRIIDLVIGWGRPYEQIVLVAPSSGLMLAHDIAADLERTSTKDVSIISIDGLPSKIYLKTIGLSMARVLPFGPIFNLLSRLVWRFTFKPDLSAQEKLTNSTDVINLRRLWWSYKTYPLSAWRDQLMYILTWENRQLLNKTRFVDIRSEHDELVSDMATSICRNMAGDGFIEMIRVAGVKHLRLLDEPDLYEAAIVRALELLEIERV